MKITRPTVVLTSPFGFRLDLLDDRLFLVDPNLADDPLLERQPDIDRGMHADPLQVVGGEHLGRAVEDHAVAGLDLVANVAAEGREVVATHHDVLRRRDDRLTVGRAEDVVRAHHQHRRLDLRLDGERQVDGHLVAVEVGVEPLADQRVNADGVAFDQHRLERLDAHAVQRRGAIQQHRVASWSLLRGCPRPGRPCARASSWPT